MKKRKIFSSDHVQIHCRYCQGQTENQLCDGCYTFSNWKGQKVDCYHCQYFIHQTKHSGICWKNGKKTQENAYCDEWLIAKIFKKFDFHDGARCPVNFPVRIEI